MGHHLTSLKIRCVQSGTNITQLCKEAGINRQLISTWEKKEPKTLAILRKLEMALEKHERIQSLSNAPQF